MANCLLIPEILEMVLLNVPPIQVIASQRVCKTWHSLTITSPTLISYTTTGVSLADSKVSKERFSNEYGGRWYFPRSPITPLSKSILDRLWTRVLPDALKTWNRPKDEIPDRKKLAETISHLYDTFTPICDKVPLLFPEAEFVHIRPSWKRWVPWCDCREAESEFKAMFEHKMCPTDTHSPLRSAMDQVLVAAYSKVPRGLSDRFPEEDPLNVDVKPKVVGVKAWLWIQYRELMGEGEEEDKEEDGYDGPCTYSLNIECYKPLDPPVEVRKFQTRYMGEVRYSDCSGLKKDF
ncbi:hypothetical protein TWF694_009022 [Orbilia ellipsospora]|uniref:F-box domain-containing protein n=1 Tax=Orbilia ellipsospora TaxID=2528407 RepID=A0AAV9XDM1_9PEZI